ncbi:MAG: glycoside hydrolase, partial [Acidobacteriaceae bacterium]|nr:glycoside hydrolase [Acidobacteriaceae bacterium]
PWKIFGEGPGTEASAQSSQFNESKRKDLTAADVRFTTKNGSLYALVMGWPENQAVIRPLAQQTELQVGKIQSVALLGFDGKLDWSQDSSGLKVTMPQQKPSDYAIVFKVTGAL